MMTWPEGRMEFVCTVPAEEGRRKKGRKMAWGSESQKIWPGHGGAYYLWEGQLHQCSDREIYERPVYLYAGHRYRVPAQQAVRFILEQREAVSEYE